MLATRAEAAKGMAEAVLAFETKLVEGVPSRTRVECASPVKTTIKRTLVDVRVVVSRSEGPPPGL